MAQRRCYHCWGSYNFKTKKWVTECRRVKCPRRPGLRENDQSPEVMAMSVRPTRQSARVRLVLSVYSGESKRAR
jgi:hypothetical protein